ncbi:MAG: hypothetical protein WED33_05995 [Bacteroidia bacterium]
MNQKMGIWIDQSKAALVSVNENKASMRTISSPIEKRTRKDGEGKDFGRFGNQYLDPEKRAENKKLQQRNEFLKNVMFELKDVEEFVVFGPAEMKTELRKSIEKDRDLLPKLKSVENAEKMTDNQLIAWVKDYFKE